MTTATVATRTMFTKRGQFDTHLTDPEALEVCRRIARDHRDFSFADSLCTQFAGRGLSVNQLSWLHRLALDQLDREKLPTTIHPAKPAPVGNFKVIIDFVGPPDCKLVQPCVTFGGHIADDGSDLTIRIRKASPRGQSVGKWWISNAMDGDANRLFGHIDPNGDFYPRPGCPTAVFVLLDEFQVDPLLFVVKYGKKTGQCCFCNMGLDDPNSVFLGFGPVCARHRGLPHGKRGVALMKQMMEQKGI